MLFDQMFFDIEKDYQLSLKLKTTTIHKFCKIDSKLNEVFDDFEKGYDYSYVSGAEWSTHDLIRFLISKIGPAELTAATWSVASHAAIRLIDMLKKKDFTAINMLVDWRVQVRTPDFLALARMNFANISVTSCHAKVFVLQNDNWSVSVVGSANFTNNPRIEAGHISTNVDTANFHKKWIMSEIKKAAPFGVDMRKVGKKDGRK